MNPLLKKLLTPHKMEYLSLNQDLVIVEKSLGVQRFADTPNQVTYGADIRLGFPELIGLEDILIDILEERRSSFELKGIARFLDETAPFYFDIYIISNRDSEFINNLILVFEDVTEKMVVEQTLGQRTKETTLLLNALSKNKDYIEKIINSMAEALIVTNSSGSIKTVNGAAQNLFGYSEQELIDRPISKIIDNRQFLEQTIQNHILIRKKSLSNVEVICQTKIGEEISVAFSCSAIKTDIEELYDFVYIGRDITDRQRTEKALQETTTLQRAILDSANYSIISTSLDGIILTFNAAAERWLGYSASEVIGRATPLLFHDRAEIVQRAQELSIEPNFGVFVAKVQPGNAEEREWSYIRKDGTHFPVLLSVSALGDRNGNITGFIAIGSDITERKRGEAVERRLISCLQESERRFRTNFEQAPIGIALVELDGQLRDCNPALQRMLAYPPQEISKLKFTDVTHPEDLDTDLKLFQEVIAGDRNYYQIEKRYIRKDRQLVWARLNVALVRDASDRPQFCISMVEDITERKQVETALRESEEKYRSVVNKLKEVIFQTDTNGVWIFLNPAWTEITGFSVDETIGTTFLNYVHPEDRQKNVELFQLLRQRQKEYCRHEIRYLTKDGGFRWIEVFASLYLDNNGLILGCSGTLNDITERKQVQEALLREREQLRQIIATAPVAMALFDTQMRYIAHSQKWLSDYGIEEQSIIGQSHYQLFPDIPDRWKSIHQQALKGEAISNPEDIFEREDGSKIYLRWAIHPWNDAEGKVGGLIIATHAINELVEAREAALQASRYKSEFLANMSHEIRTPMNGVIGMTGLLLKTNLNSEQQDFVQTIRVCADNLLTIINEILDFSKLEAGQIELEMVNFDLTSCIEEVADLLAVHAEIKGLELATLIEKNVPKQLQGDVGRLRQILMNLVGNAIKFTLQGEVVVQVALQSENATQVSLLFSVTDTGIGISHKAQQKLFKPFSQVDASTTRKYGGTGLGLIISKQLVEIMQGEIGVESSVGKGAKFWFTVTFNKQVNSQSQQFKQLDSYTFHLSMLYLRYLALLNRTKSSQESRKLLAALKKNIIPPEVLSKLENGSSNSLNGKKVLVVDDNATNRKIVRYQATSWGMQVDEADGAIMALNAMRNAVEEGKPYDVAILDMQMPEIDGAMLGEMIKSVPAIAQTKLIMLTSMAHRNGAEKMLKKGFSAYLIKPVKESRLFDCLMNSLNPNIFQNLGNTSESNQKRIAKLVSNQSQPNTAHLNLKILLVEDNLINQKVALNQLKILGYEADCVANGKEALAMLDQIRYDIVFMDCQMPILDGYKATQMLRKREGSDRHTVVIAMTANAMKDDRDKCLEAGMDDYISKPVNMKELETILEHWAFKNETKNNIILEQKAEIEAKSSPPQTLNLNSDNLEITRNNTQSLSTEVHHNDLIDLKRLHQISDGDREFEIEILQTFIQSAIINLNAIKQAVQNYDFATVEHQAHQLKGSSGNVGVTSLQEIAAKLEIQARQKHIEGEAEMLENLENILEQVKVFISNLTRME